MKVLAGDYKKDCGILFAGDKLQIQKSTFSFDYIKLSDIVNFQIVTEENKASILGKVGWGAVGVIALGPLGLLAGVLGGGNKRERVMAIESRDGRKLLLKGNSKDAEKLTAATFNNDQAEAKLIEGSAQGRIEPGL